MPGLHEQVRRLGETVSWKVGRGDLNGLSDSFPSDQPSHTFHVEAVSQAKLEIGRVLEPATVELEDQLRGVLLFEAGPRIGEAHLDLVRETDPLLPGRALP